MPIQEGKYVTPAWQNGGPPALDAAELTDMGNSIVKNQTDIEQNTTDIQSANSSIQQNAQDIDSLQTWQSTVNGQISSIQTNYLQKSGGTMTGVLNMGNNKIINLGTPSSGNDAVTKSYADNLSKLNWTLLASQYFNLSYNGTTSMKISGISPIYATSNQYKAILIYANISTFSWKNVSGYTTEGISFDQIPLVTVRIGVEGGNHSVSGITCVALLTKKVIVCEGDGLTSKAQWQSFELGSNNNLDMAYSSEGNIGVTSTYSSFQIKATGNIYVYYLD